MRGFRGLVAVLMLLAFVATAVTALARGAPNAEKQTVAQMAIQPVIVQTEPTLLASAQTYMNLNSMTFVNANYAAADTSASLRLSTTGAWRDNSPTSYNLIT